MRLTLHLTAVDNMSRVVSSAMRNSMNAVQSAQAQARKTAGEAREGMFDAGMMAAGGVAALAYPLKMAANYERLRVQMNILTRSTVEGGRAFNSVVKLASETPLTLSEVANAQTMMMGYGQSARDAASAIKMLGDITSVTQGDLTGAIVAYGQAAQEGKMLTRDVRQFINSGVPAVSILQDMLGKDKNIFKMAEEGKITFDLLQKAMTKATSSGGMFADGLKTQANTLQGSWVKFTDTLDRTAAVFGEALIPAAKALLGPLMTGLTAISDFMREHKTLAQVMMGAVAAFTLVASGVFIYSSVLWIANTTVGMLILTSLRFPFTLLIGGFKALNWSLFGTVERLVLVIGWMRTFALTTIPAFVAGTIAAIAKTNIWIASLLNLSATIYGIPLLGWILAVIAAIIAIGVAIYKNWDAVSGFFKMMWNEFNDFLPKAKQWGGDLIRSIKDGIVGEAPTLFAAVGKVVEFTRGFFPASPAKHGAFKDIHRIKIIEQVAKTVKASPLRDAIGRATDTAMSGFGGGATATPAFATVGGGSVAVNYSPTINFGGGASEVERASLMEQLNAHKDAVARMVQDAMRSNDRKRF